MGTCTIIIKYAIAFATGVLLTKGIATMDTITIVSGIVTAILTSIVALKDVLLSIAETSFDVASDDSSIDDYEVDTTEHIFNPDYQTELPFEEQKVQDDDQSKINVEDLPTLNDY